MSIWTEKSKLLTGLVAAIIISFILLLLVNFFKKESVETEVESTTVVTNNRMPDMQTGAFEDTIAPSVDASGKPSTPFITGVEGLPHSLQGTDVDGEIIIDGNNRLVPTRGLRRLYDYFLSALGEETAETIDARIEAYITSRTPEPAASTAVALYYTYKNYLEQLGSMQENYSNFQMQATQAGELDLNLLNQRQIEVNKIRKDLFNPETVAAFFDSEDQLHNYNVAMVEIARDDTLTAEQREQAKLDYVSRLPDSLIKKRVQQEQGFKTLIDRTQRMKAQGASADELFSMRAELVGIPAAQRLAAVDNKNDNFDQRFEHFEAAKKQIVATTEDDLSQQAQLNTLKKELFNEAEQKRLTGYEVLKSEKEKAASVSIP